MSELHEHWKGLLSNVNPHDAPPGTTVSQDNIGIFTPGTLSVRRGMVPVSFTNVTPSGSANCIAVFKFDRPEARWVIYLRTDGTIQAIRDGAAVSIRTGVNTFFPPSAVRSRQGNLIIVNGVDRGAFWDGLSSTSELLGVDAPTSAATTGTSAGTSGGATAGNYVMAYRYVDQYGIPSNLSPTVTQPAPDYATFSWSSLLTSLQTRCSSAGTKELYRTTSGQTDVYYLVASTTAGATTYAGDTYSDTDLSARTALPVYNDDGTLNANRFVPPPTQKPFVAIYQDRTFYYGNVTYTTGTVEVQSGTPTILRGTSTAWTEQMVGKYVYLAGATKPYLISAYTSATQLTTSTSMPTTAAGSSYTIRNGPSEQRLLYYSEPDEPESVPTAQNAIPLQENVQDHDFETGLVAFNSFLYALHERHIYAINFAQQGDVKLAARLIAERGCVNNRCWVVAEGVLYLLDQLGVYSVVEGGNVTPLSDAIQDLWRNATLDFSTTKWWWGEYEPNEKVVRFFVNYVGDTNTRPKRALCYSTLSGAWWTESYNWELGGGCRTQVSNKIRLVVGGESDTVYLSSEGLSDGVTTAIRGTATSATSTTLTDSGASFAASVIGAPVAIIAGTGKGQVRTITARTSTQLTVAAWTTTPDSSSVYLVGGIAWLFKTGLMKFEADPEGKQKRRQCRVVYPPTTNAATLDVRRYLNHNSLADVFQIPWDTGTGLTTDGTTDATANLQVSQFAGGNAPGYFYIPFDDGIDQQAVSDRWLAVDLRGFQGLDRIEVYRMEITGAERN